MATSYAPAAIVEVREYLKPITGLDNFGLGIVNSETDASYHHGWSQRDTDGTDYSWDESSRDWSWTTNAARALDIGMFPQLREFSIWLVGECERGAPDTLDIREIIYSPDGVVVKRWDRLKRRTSGGDSHLTHTHVSWFADAEHKSKMGPFVRFFGGLFDMFYMKVTGVENPAIYCSDGLRSRKMPEGTWPWIERLVNSGVPYHQDLPNVAMVEKLGGPMDVELGEDSGGGSTPVPFPTSLQLEIPGFTVTATVTEGE